MSSDIEKLLAELTSGDDRRAQRAIEALAERPFDFARHLQRLMVSEDEEARWWAVAALAHFPPEVAGRALIAALHDSDTAVRQCALLGLQRQPREEALPALIGLLGEVDTLTARLAGGALAQLGEAAIPALQQVMAGENDRARIQAARALAEMKLEATIPILYEALDDPLSMVVYWAEEGLARLGVGMMFFKP